MVSCFKNYGFTAQNLWFHPSKPMFLQPKSIGFFIEEPILSLKKKKIW